MNRKKLMDLLGAVREKKLSVSKAFKFFQGLPYEDLGDVKLDSHRIFRKGYPEAVYGEGKSFEQIKKIVKSFLDLNQPLLVTRASEDVYKKLIKKNFVLEYHKIAKMIYTPFKRIGEENFEILVMSAGASDMKVAEEAALTAEILGCGVKRLFDVGVGGLQRLIKNISVLQEAKVIIVVAGMEASLGSVVGGLVGCPVIGVPTSVGYGAHFQGLASLLSMLNSCADGVCVVNIDNGYGAGIVARSILNI